MLDKVIELTEPPYSYEIIFHYEKGYYPKTHINCTIKRPYFRHLGVKRGAYTEEEALEKSLKFLDYVKEIEEKYGDIKPPDSGYKQIISLENELSLNIEIRPILGYERRDGSELVIRGIRTVDKFGYTLTDPFNELGYKIDELKDCSDIMLVYGEKYDWLNKEIAKVLLAEDERLYMWDDIRMLSGSAGCAIVKDGEIKRYKTVLIS